MNKLNRFCTLKDIDIFLNEYCPKLFYEVEFHNGILTIKVPSRYVKDINKKLYNNLPTSIYCEVRSIEDTFK